MAFVADDYPDIMNSPLWAEGNFPQKHPCGAKKRETTDPEVRDDELDNMVEESGPLVDLLAQMSQNVVPREAAHNTGGAATSERTGSGQGVEKKGMVLTKAHRILKKRARGVVEQEPGTQAQQGTTAVHRDHRNRRRECGKDTPGTYRCTHRVHGPPGTYCPKCTGRTCECECESCRVAYDSVEEHTEESDPEPKEHEHHSKDGTWHQNDHAHPTPQSKGHDRERGHGEERCRKQTIAVADPVPLEGVCPTDLSKHNKRSPALASGGINEGAGGNSCTHCGHCSDLTADCRAGKRLKHHDSASQLISENDGNNMQNNFCPQPFLSPASL